MPFSFNSLYNPWYDSITFIPIFPLPNRRYSIPHIFRIVNYEWMNKQVKTWQCKHLFSSVCVCTHARASSPPTLQSLVFVSKVSGTFRPLGETWSWDLVCFSWLVWCIESSEQWRQNCLSMLASWPWSSRQALWNQFMWFINWFMWPSLILLPFYLLPTSILRELN